MGILKRLFGVKGEEQKAIAEQDDKSNAEAVYSQQRGKPPAVIVNRLNEISWNDWNNPPPNVLVMENIKIAGVTYTNPDGVSRQEILARMIRWEVVDLVHEASNPHDPNAVAIIGGMGQIGYVPAGTITGLHKLLDSGIKTQCKLSHLYGGKDEKSWGGMIDIHIVAPLETVVMDARVVGITGKNADGELREDIAEWLEVGDVVGLEAGESDEGETIIRVLHEGAEFGRLDKRVAAKVLPHMLNGAYMQLLVSAVEAEGERKIFISIAYL
jgi:hypothetical protein